MSEALTNAIPGLGLILILGMRHGLDPDHLAAIDGLTMRSFAARPRWAPWTGGLFALGHGIVVMVIALIASLASEKFAPSEDFFAWLEWLPIALLLLLGSLNAFALLRKTPYQMIGLRSRFLPSWLRESSGPVATIFCGMVFALVFDTALQAAAWGYAATAIGGTSAALMVGLIFTFGMTMTDLVDGWVAARVMRSGHGDALSVFRRRIGWPIVVMCFAIAAYGIAHKLNPAVQLSDGWYSALGAMMLTAMVVLYGYTLHSLRK